MGIQSRSHKMWQWVLASAVAGITIITFLQGFIYSKADGQTLEKRVEHIEGDIKDDKAQTREDLQYIRERVDKIYDRLSH